MRVSIHCLALLVVSVGSLVSCVELPRLSVFVNDGNVPLLIPWDKLDHIVYGTAVPSQNGTLTQYSSVGLATAVFRAHANSKKISLNIGGRTGSMYLSSLVSTPRKRSALAKRIGRIARLYNLDGINIDWEYPNSVDGLSCNEHAPLDTAHLLQFLQDVRRRLKKHVMLTASVNQPFNDRNQKPETRFSHSWSVLDGLYVMAYDMKNGTNAPLYSAYPGPPPSPSVETFVQTWIDARIPASKLILGVPFYGRVRSTDPAANGTQIQGDRFDTLTKDPCPDAIPTYSGIYQYRSIARILDKMTNLGWNFSFDATTMTPFLTQDSTHSILSYDNAASLRAKTDFATSHQLGGVMATSLEMDDSQHTLLGALQAIRL